MNLPYAAADPLACARVITILYCVSVALGFMEKLTLVSEYDRDGWFSWRLLQFDRLHLSLFRRFPQLGDSLFGQKGMAVVFVSGLLGVVLVLASPVSSLWFFLGVSGTVAGSLVSQVRSSYGGDGSQQMNVLIGAAILLGFNPWVGPQVAMVTLVFIAAQSCFAYCTSGMSKIVSSVWMRGDPLVGILSTTAYGSPLGLRLVLGLSGTRRLFALTMVAFEASFPLAVIGPSWLLLGYLALGLTFHAANALFMGLNTFFWSFVATYPAICFVWVLLH